MSEDEAKDEKKIEHQRIKTYQAELIEELNNPIHKRLVKAYKSSSPVNSMEDELGKILLEVLNDEN